MYLDEYFLIPLLYHVPLSVANTILVNRFDFDKTIKFEWISSKLILRSPFISSLSALAYNSNNDKSEYKSSQSNSIKR